ncbi:mannitol dehydrogenase family protein [Curtobacterium sp. MCBD17_013]|uniref:mannitol dehydrogenase family protein n=1 Tax=Curtobacterium sp. MCBD17_013 TaxID=2175668 RepID=UPI000DA9B08D|nr:mannitol dehydrogenase family protein [Curtobacterium sp. MCBD17_013]PZF58734.1 mannitol dehydrogenase family protein [Curtobacterium sp. MCBD17_013]
MTGGTAPDRRPGIVHLGIGAFARAHLAWYTQRAGTDDDGRAWGIVGFTGRSPDAATTLTAQDCRYTLVERAADGDTATAMDVVVAAHPGSDTAAWRTALASPTTAIVTLTVTEAGYRPGSGVADRLVDGLRARATAEGGPLTLVSLDNLAGNGRVLAGAVREAVGADPDLLAWIDRNVTFPDAMVDRITPATTDEDRAAVQELPGAVPDDRVPVVAEPFAEWVLADRFAGDRPPWERAGVRIVDDVEPYEQRKLWLLNAAHSLLAYLGLLLGHTTVAEAIADPRCRGRVDQLWDEAGAEVRLPADEIAAARAAMLERWANPRIRHTLRQIASDGSRKLPVRIVDPLRRRLARDPDAGVGPGTATVVAAWWLHCALQADLVSDDGAPAPDADVHDVLAVLDPDLDTDPVVAAITAAATRIRTMMDTDDGDEAVDPTRGATA